MGGVCSMNRRDGKCVQNLVGKHESDHSEGLEVDEKIILKWILKK
jgi:hypothetical protein